MRTEIAKNGRLIFLIIGILGLLLLGPQIIYFPWGIKEARAAAVSSVQSGTTTSTANGTVTVDITDVDPAKSFLIFQTRHNSNRPPGSQIRGRINATGTLLEFARVTDGIAPEPVTITIRWYVVQFSSGVRVQRGEVSQSAIPVNVSITPVASLSQAFVTWSKTPAAADTSYDANDPILGELTTTSNLQFRANGASASLIIWWQVIEFTDPADINVQKGTTSLLGAATSVTVTPVVPVNVSSTFVLVGFRTAGSGADVGSRMLQAILNADGTITIDRSISGTPDDITEIVWQAVELKDGSTVQRGSVNFPLAGAQQIVSLGTPVDTNRSIALASVQPVGGQNMGRSPYAGDDIIGVGSVTMALSATQITMDRDNTAATADIGWFAVQFSNCGFFYRKSITVQSGQVQGGPHTDFPMLVSLTDPDLRTLATGGHVTSSLGYDIIFRAVDSTTCGGTAPCTLAHEIEKYDPSTGELVAWARVPSINNGTVIYMYYGNNCITSLTENPTGVWDSNYKGVWHLHDDFEDSTSNNHDGINNGTTNYASANIADGDDFNGTNGYIQTDSNELQTENNFTISLWFNADATNFARHLVWEGLGTANGFGDGAASTHQEMHLSFGRLTGGVSEANYLTFFLGDTDDVYGDIIQASYAFSDITNWHHAAVVVTGLGSSPRAELFLDGSSVASDTGLVARTSRTSWNTNLRFGRPGANERYFDGGLDEVRIATTNRSAGWITTEYNNQRPSSTFYTVGTEQQAAPTAVTLKSFTATQYSEGILLKWKTGYEVSNLGFHIYREERGQLTRLTPEPVAGSALLAGSRTAMTAGHHYHWWDASLSPQSSSLSPVSYWLKDIDLNGTETMHGPVTTVFSREPLPEKFRPEFLSEIGWRIQERYHHYWKVQELKERLGKRPSPIRHQQSAKSASSGETRRAAAQSSVLSTDQFRLSPQSRYESIPTSSLDTVVQQSLASHPAVKLTVREEGWYRVTQPELVVAGLSSKVNPEYLQLFMEGQEQPIRVIGGKNGRFGPGDAIEFYGVGLDTPSTDKRVYWLIEGSRPGKRVEVSHSQGGQISSSSFLSTVECKDRVIYFSALRNGEEENFFGSVVSPSGADQFLTLRHLDPAPSGEALLEVILQGATEGTHRVGVLLNEVEVGEVVFEGFLKELFQVGVPQALLEEGENLVSLIARGGEMDYSLLDLIRLSYWHTYEADGDELKFGGRGGEHLSISGFTHPTVQVVDITDPNDLVEVFGKVRAQGGAYLVEFEVPGRGERRLLACTADRIKSPSETVPNRASSWSQSSLGYDFVMISHRDFIEALKPLKQLRESKGLSVALIDIEDIYDEFSFGVKSPKAIKDFLALAKSNWQKPPRFVLLVGDASSDPRNYLGYGDFDLVPTKLVETAYLETASDDWFVDFNEDGLPEMAVGRFSVQTAEETAGVVSKTVGYEKSSKNKEALLVADKADNSDDFNFVGASEEVRALLPAYITVKTIFRGDFGSDAQAKAELLSGINQGPLLVNFIGHGSLEIWRGLLSSEDVGGLINGMRLPFFVSMTCLNGFFQAPYADTLAEALLKAPQGGAVAVWTSSGLTEPDKQAIMSKELIRLLFSSSSITLGEATARAKSSVSDQDVRKTWILFGDPTTRLK